MLTVNKQGEQLSSISSESSVCVCVWCVMEVLKVQTKRRWCRVDVSCRKHMSSISWRASTVSQDSLQDGGRGVTTWTSTLQRKSNNKLVFLFYFTGLSSRRTPLVVSSIIQSISVRCGSTHTGPAAVLYTTYYYFFHGYYTHNTLLSNTWWTI